MMSTNTHTLPKALIVLIFATGFYLFFGTLILAPLVNITLFATFHITTKLMIVAVGAIIMLAQLFFIVPAVSKRALTKVPKYLKVLLGIFALSFVASIIFSASLKTSLFGMFGAWEYNAMSYLLFGVVGVGWWEFFVIAKLYKFEKLLFTTLITSTLLAVIIYGLGDYYLWHLNNTYVSNGIVRLTLGFTNPLFAAYFIGMLWSYQLSATLQKLQEPIQKGLTQPFSALWHLLLFSGITHLLLITFTRSAWIAAGASAFAILLFQLWNNRSDRSRIARNTVTTLLLALIIFAQGYSYKKQISERNTDLRNESTQTLSTIAGSLGNSEDQTAALAFFQKADSFTSSQIRLMEWSWGIRTWASSAKNVLFGIGPDAAFYEMPKTRDPIFNDLPTDSTVKPYYVRNLYINFLMQHGLIATVSAVLLLFLVFWGILKGSFTKPETIAVLAAYLAQGVFYYPTLLTTILLVFVLAYQLATDADVEAALLRKPNVLERLLIISLLLVIIAWLYPLLKAEFTLKTYNTTIYPPSQEIMAENSKLPISNNILKRYYTYYYYNSDLGKTYLSQLEKSNDIDDLRVTADAYYLWARKDNSVDLAQKSINTLERLLTIEDTLPSTWDGLGLRYLYIHDYDKAIQKFNKALELKNDYWYAYLHIGETLRQQCKPQEALDWYKKAKPYVPSTDKEIMETEAEIKTPSQECTAK